MPVDELAQSLGLGGGTGRHSPMWRTLDRIVRFRFAEWSAERELDVYTEVPPLSPRQLERVPESTRAKHDQLLGAHLDGLAAATGAATTDESRPIRIADRLDRNRDRSLQQLFRWLVDDGEVTVSPIIKMRPPKVPEQPVPVFTDDELRRLLATAEGRSFEDLRDRALIRLVHRRRRPSLGAHGAAIRPGGPRFVRRGP